jgi:hypothetical protein
VKLVIWPTVEALSEPAMNFSEQRARFVAAAAAAAY